MRKLKQGLMEKPALPLCRDTKERGPRGPETPLTPVQPDAGVSNERKKNYTVGPKKETTSMILKMNAEGGRENAQSAWEA